MTHYIADDHGYRIITPGEKVEVYRPEGGDDKSSNDVEPGTHHSNLRFGKFTPWGQLYFPKGCSSVRTKNGTILYFPGVPKPKNLTEPYIIGAPATQSYSFGKKVLYV